MSAPQTWVTGIAPREFPNMMLPSSSAAEFAVTDASSNRPTPSPESGFRPDLSAVLQQLTREFPDVPAEYLREVFVSGLTSLDTISRGALPEMLYRLTGARLSTFATRCTIESDQGGGSRPPPATVPEPRSGDHEPEPGRRPSLSVIACM